MFKLLFLAVAIYCVYRWYDRPSIEPPANEAKDDDQYADYEEVD